MIRYFLLTLLFFVVIFGIIGFHEKTSETIQIRGSQTFYPLCFSLSQAFEKIGKVKFDLKSEGSEVGIAALQKNLTDIALSSRPLQLAEKISLQEAGLCYSERIIAYDALAIIVHPDNPVTKLEKEEVKKIYSGEITNWSEVGGTDEKIEVFSRDRNSGTYHFFNELFLDKNQPGTNTSDLPGNKEIIQTVAKCKNAISYIGLGYIDDRVKGVSLSMDEGKTYVSPDKESVQSQLYPVIRPLYFYYLNKNESKVSRFVNYVLSETGQRTVLEAGYIPLKNHKTYVARVYPPI